MLQTEKIAEDNINEAKNLNFDYGKVEIIEGKEENAGHRHFLLF